MGAIKEICWIYCLASLMIIGGPNNSNSIQHPFGKAISLSDDIKEKCSTAKLNIQIINNGREGTPLKPSVLSNIGSSALQKVDPEFEIYLLLGQSNMAGRGDLQ